MYSPEHRVEILSRLLRRHEIVIDGLHPAGSCRETRRLYQEEHAALNEVVQALQNTIAKRNSALSA